MDKRSIISYEHYKEALQKFEYFLIGLIGIICGYVVQDYTPSKLDLNPSTLELISLLLFFSSFYLSIKRAENIIMGNRLNFQKLSKGEEKGALMEVINKGLPQLLNKETGEIMTYDEVNSKITLLTKELIQLKNTSDKVNNKIKTLYSWRYTFLYSGFILLIASKVWQAYT